MKLEKPRKLTSDYNLAILNPKIAKQWHPTKNGDLTAKDVTPRSNKKVWWKCQKSHEWDALISNRTNGRGCPECGGKKAGRDNNLLVKFPEVAKEWHPTKNGDLTAKDVTPGSNKKVWWQCGKGHEWDTTIKNRTNGRGCPECGGRKVGRDNNLLVKFPEVAKEWHPTKNGDLTAKDVTAGTHQKIWWQCGKGHEWDAICNNRTRGSGCPYCKKERKKREL